MSGEQEQTATGNRRQQRNMPAPFVVEFGDDGNRSITIDTLRLTVRGAWSVATLHNREEGGRDLGAVMSGMPAIPGLRMAVDPRAGTAVLFDPLSDDEELRERITRVLNRSVVLKTRETIKAVKDQEFELNDDQLKTLCIELVRKCTGRACGVHGVHLSAKLVKGDLPTEEQIGQMPGEELIELWNEGRHPRYRKDVPQWEKRLEAMTAV